MSEVQIAIYQQQARAAKGEDHLDRIVAAAFNAGAARGREDRQREVRDALSSLGLTDAALFNTTED